MAHTTDLIAADVHAYLAQHERKELLRFLTCGSVDDGKSTLIGRLLYDSKMIYEDQLAAIRKDTAKYGTTGGDFDPALLTDGLKAEREQGITIDVAYRYFSTAKRKFIIADTPGHEQYTRNMATGASTCDLAIILIDARKGVLTQTRRHSFIVSLLGIRHVLVAVNKMDLVDWKEDVFDAIRRDYADLAAKLDLRDVQFIPLSALHGDNVVEPSANTPWYSGGTLMHFLENVHIASDRNLIDFRLPVQYVNRPHQDFRGFCGTIAGGVVRRGDEVMALPSRRTSRVRSILTPDGEADEAFAPMAATLTLEDEIDVSRGDVLVRPGNVPRVEERFDAMIVWMSEQPLVPGRPYLLKHTAKTVGASVASIRYRIDVNTLHRVPAPVVEMNEIARCEVSLAQPIAFDPYVRNRATGAFILIDRVTNGTVAAGMILDATADAGRRDRWDAAPVSKGLHAEPSQVTPAERASRLGQQPMTILLTGLPFAGKSTLARAVERRLFDLGRACMVLDGQNVRMGLSRDLGFSAEDRSENLRRAAETAKLMNDAGLICICAFVAPSEEDREQARALVGEARFLTVHLAAPIATCRARDGQGLYAAAETGSLMSFPGVTVAYVAPLAPDLALPTHEWPVDRCVEAIVSLLRDRGVITEIVR